MADTRTKRQVRYSMSRWTLSALASSFSPAKRIGEFMRIQPESMRALKRSKGSDGKAVPGLWESDIVRMEWFDGAWHCQVPMREIGRTQFYEFRPLAMAGIGSRSDLFARELLPACTRRG
ncbi:hypothetical protein AT395_25215 (plasmid) [Pandoraea apista]|nr:hypothetical protein AT395_25215 [Pandoraea apista]